MKKYAFNIGIPYNWMPTKLLRVMKITMLLLLISLVQVSAATFAQKLTMKQSNASLREIFNQINLQTGYDVVVKSEQLKNTRSINVNFTNENVSSVLNKILPEQNLAYTITDNTIIIKPVPSEPSLYDVLITRFQSIDVRGKVVDSLGNPLSGASITLKGTNRKVIANVDGEFLIDNVDEKAVLVISYMGYETKEIIAQKDVGDIIMEVSFGKLEEVVVSTGYQTIPKERATGSFTLIDKQLYNEQVGTTVLERLKYISNGVIPLSNRAVNSGTEQLLIRGISTISSIQKPLIILDNFEYQGDVNNINPNDIENVTILKDAAAGSIWGAKAANGVIVITTKKGKFNQKTNIAFNSNVSIIDAPNLFYQNNISSGDLIDVEKYLFSQKFRFSDTSATSHPAFSPVYEILFKQQKGILTSEQANAQMTTLRDHDLRDDYGKYLYQKAVNQQYALNMQGGSNELAWALSVGLDKNVSQLKAGFDRATFRFGNTYKPFKNLEINANLSFTQGKTQSGVPAYGTINTLRGTLPVYIRLADDNGNALPVYTKYRQGYIDELGGGRLMDWRYYPLDDYTHVKNESALQDFNAVFGANYKVISGLNVDIKYRVQKQLTDNSTLSDQQSYFTRDLINSFTQFSGTSTIYKIPKGDILDTYNNEILAQNLRGQINFDKLSGQHNVTLLAGSEISETVSNSNSYRTYGYDQNILTSVNVDLTNAYPNFISGRSFIPGSPAFGKTNTRFMSFYGNGAYTYKNRYTISASMRRDASNMFGVATNDKWKPLYSSGISWDISKEQFYHFSPIPDLKFRLTYGTQGNVDPSKVAVLTLKYQGTSSFTLTPRAVINNYVNPDLQWEQVSMVNAAVDFSTHNQRISGSIEYYWKNATGLYGPSPIDVTTGLGVTSITKNVGEMKGHGLDILINTINTTGKIRWTSALIFNTYKDRITKYYDQASATPSQLVGNTGAIEGNPSFYLAVYRSAGLDPVNGNPRGYLNGIISSDWESITGGGGSMNDIRYIGPRLPVIFGSVGNTLNWKGISVTARMTYKLGYYFLRNSINYTSLVNNLNGHGDYALRWQKPGDENVTDVPSFIYPANNARDVFYQNSESLVSKGDNIRLQYINATYSINSKGKGILPVKRIHLYVVVNDIGIIWRSNKHGLDPDFAALPPPRTYSLGLKLDFN